MKIVNCKLKIYKDSVYQPRNVLLQGQLADLLE